MKSDIYTKIWQELLLMVNLKHTKNKIYAIKENAGGIKYSG